MSISARIETTIEHWTTLWKERMRGFVISIIQFGLEAVLHAIGKGLSKELKPMLDSLEEASAEIPEIRDLIKIAKEGKGEWQALLMGALGGSAIAGTAGSALFPPLEKLKQVMSKKFPFQLLPIAVLLMLKHRKLIPEEDYLEHFHRLGFADPEIDWMEKSFLYYFDPVTITRIWLRDKPAYEKYWEDLKAQGWDDDRIKVAKELAKIIPPLADMVRFADFSAFDPEVIAKWREFYDAPSWISDPMSLIGITNEPPRDWANKYWFSHWIQPGRYELGEIYRRGLLGEPLIGKEEIGEGGGEGEAEELVKLAYRTMGYSPFWQGLLLQLTREVPTRVDVRRWWDMRTIDEAELRNIYQRRGYFGKDLENYVLWTKVYVAFPDLIARWKNSWITEDEVRSELKALKMPEDRIEEMIQTKIKPMQPARVEGERTATATEIMKAVKKGFIGWDEGIDRLVRMGYSEDEADFKLNVYVGVAEGSPETYMEFVDLTERYRKAMGLEAKIPPPELIEAGKALKEAEIARKEAVDKGFSEVKLAPYEKAVSDASYRYRQLLTKWKAET